jgi:hypothetical protein
MFRAIRSPSGARAPAAPERRHRPNLSRDVSRPPCSPAESSPTAPNTSPNHRQTPLPPTHVGAYQRKDTGVPAGLRPGTLRGAHWGPSARSSSTPACQPAPIPTSFASLIHLPTAACSRPSSAPGDPTASSPPASSAMLSYAPKHLRQLSTSHATQDVRIEHVGQLQPHGATGRHLFGGASLERSTKAYREVRLQRFPASSPVPVPSLFAMVRPWCECKSSLAGG